MTVEETVRIEAHEKLRAAIRAAAVADMRLWRATLDTEGGDFDREIADEQIAFMESAVLADYTAGVFFVDLGGQRDYHAVLTTDGRAGRHRAVGLAKLTLDWLTDV
jgi:hypothetical protein